MKKISKLSILLLAAISFVLYNNNQVSASGTERKTEHEHSGSGTEKKAADGSENEHGSDTEKAAKHDEQEDANKGSGTEKEADSVHSDSKHHGSGTEN